MINNYIELIFQQRIKNPLYQKDYRLIYLPQQVSSTNELNKIRQWPNIKFTNVVYRPTSLYKDVNDNYYYEFVETGNTFNTILEDWKFFYIPLSKYSELLTIYPNLLPSFKYYDINQSSNILTQRVDYQILIPFTRPPIYYFNSSTVENKHPLSSIFKFTGYSFLNIKGQLIYEYTDSSNYCDEENITYYSDIRPLHYYPNSYLISNYCLQNDISLIRYKNNPPSKETLYLNIVQELRFTGNTTTKEFSLTKKWYEYNTFENGQPFGKILLPSKPTDKSVGFIKIQLNNTNIGFKYNLTFNTSYISINQTSSNNKIILS